MSGKSKLNNLLRNAIILMLAVFLVAVFLVKVEACRFNPGSSNKMSHLKPMIPIKVLPLSFHTTEGNQHFFSAASGLVHLGDRYYVIADDDLSIGSLSEEGEDSRLDQIVPGTLPTDPKARKKKKPDFESLFWLSDPRLGGEGLVALPSGSKPNRFMAVFIPLTKESTLNMDGIIRIDMGTFFNAILKQEKELNIEGALVEQEHFVLFHRGNTDNDQNRFFEFKKSELIDLILGENKKPLIPIEKSSTIDVGEIDGIKLTLTDMALFEGRRYFLAAAENTSNSIDDGEIKGTVLGELTSAGHVRLITTFKKQKFEGLSIQRRESKLIRFSMVTDNDDANQISNLSIFELEVL